jgi:O-methyltransferase domain
MPMKEAWMSTPANNRDSFADLAFLTKAFQISKMIQVAVALELADRIVGGSQSVTTLALAAGANPEMLLRLCRALAAFGIFAVDTDENVNQTARSQCLRKDAVPTLHHAVMYWSTPHVWNSWANLEHAVRTGESAFESVYQMPKFDYLKAHPEEAELFDLFMQHTPDNRHAAVVAAYDFSNAGLVVDIGGGNGALLAAILQANPQARGLLFDQDVVVAGAGQTLADFAGRSQIEAGDFFQTIPFGGDTYTMSAVLHDWDDAHCLSILVNTRTAMQPNKRLLVIERLLEPEVGLTNPMNYLADISMMVNLNGRERTHTEFTQLLAMSGFGEPQIHRTTSAFCILEAQSI